MRSRVALLFIAIAVAASGCTTETSSPEELLQERVKAGERAAKEGDVALLAALISESYTDNRSYTKATLAGMLEVYYSRHPLSHMFLAVEDVSLTGTKGAQAVAVLALADEPIPTAKSLLTIRADMYRVELLLADEGSGEWRVIEADWTQARVRDFL